MNYHRLTGQRTGTVPTEVIKWNADPEFTPLNATEFLSPKVQAKWETLYPGMHAVKGMELDIRTDANMDM